MPKRDVLSEEAIDTPSMPSTLPTWQSSDDRIHLYNGDCVQWARQVRHPFAHTVFADPPFNIDYPYDRYQDKRTINEYLDWTIQWTNAIKRCLLLTGSMWVCAHAKYQAEIKVLLTQQGWHWQDTVIWHYTFGPQQKSKLTPSWVAMHHCTLHPHPSTYQLDTVKVPSARQLKYGDRRAKAGGKHPDNVWILDPRAATDCFRPDHDAILQSRVCGTFKERTGHPCQMPVAVVERCLRLTTPPDGCVIDPFAGSGTTAHACHRNGWRHIGIELSDDYLRRYAIPRLERLGS